MPRGRSLVLTLLVAMVFAFVGYGAFRGRASRRAPASNEAPRMRCGFEPGEVRSFRLAVQTDYAGERGPALDGSLFLRTLTPATGPTESAEVAGLIAPDESSELRGEVAEPFLMKMNAKCRIEAFAFRHAVTGETAAIVEGTMRLFEVVGGDTRDPAWVALQHDLNGEFFARYERVGFEGSVLTFTRHVGGYRDADDAAIRVLEHEAQGSFDAAWGFTTELAGRTRHRIVAEGSPTELAVSFTLERHDAPPPNGLPTARDTGLFAWSAPRADERPAAPETIAGMPRDEVVAMDTAAMAARLTELWSASKSPAHEQAYQFLLAWIRGRPGAAAALVSAVRDGVLDPALHGMVFLVLGTADTEESRSVLATSLTDRALGGLNRERAALSLGTNTTPTMDSFESMRAVAEASARTDEDESVRGVVQRSIGPFARDDAPEDVRTAARAYIRDLAGASDPGRRLAGIDAAGNAGADALLDAIEGGFEDADPTVRSSAYHALRDMDRELVQPIVADALGHETDDRVRRSLVEAAYTNVLRSERPTVSPELALATAAKLPSIEEAGARAAAIRLVGVAARNDPAASQALAAWLPREPQPELVQLIGQYISLEAARAALAQRAP